MSDRTRLRKASRPAESVDGETLRARLRDLANPRATGALQQFFKTAPGEYGHGDRFLGIRVPVLRKLARDSRGASLAVVLELLRSPWHEERLLAVFMLVDRYARGTSIERERIYRQYLKHVPKHVNNWDLVDSSAHLIVGAHLVDRDRDVLFELARSPHLWCRRVAIIATFWFIKRGSFADTLAIAELLLGDEQDLIHKATGWMLREVGNRDREVAERFLRQHYGRMPRTMLRYAIERFPEAKRRAYLTGAIG